MHEYTQACKIRYGEEKKFPLFLRTEEVCCKEEFTTNKLWDSYGTFDEVTVNAVQVEQL